MVISINDGGCVVEEDEKRVKEGRKVGDGGEWVWLALGWLWCLE